MQAITSERLALVKTSGMEGCAIFRSQGKSGMRLILIVRVRPVVKAAPLCLVVRQRSQGGAVFQRLKSQRKPH